MLRPYFSYFFRAQSDFGHPARCASMSIVNVIAELALLESDFLQKPGCRADCSECMRAFTRRSD
jgi:hypothetical protein